MSFNPPTSSMYSHHQEQHQVQQHQRQSFRGGYGSGQQHQRWQDQSHGRPEFAGLPPSLAPGHIGGKQHGLKGRVGHPQNQLELQSQPHSAMPPQFHPHAPHHHHRHRVPPPPHPGMIGRPRTSHPSAMSHHHRPLALALPSQGTQMSNYNSAPNHGASLVKEISCKAPEQSENKVDPTPLVQTPPRPKKSSLISNSNEGDHSRALKAVDPNSKLEALQTEKKDDKTEKNEANAVTQSNPKANKSPLKRTDFSVMSPITMCFTRMLGAAEMIKTPRDKNLLDNLKSKSIGPILPSVLESESDIPQDEASTKSVENCERDPSVNQSFKLKRSFDKLADKGVVKSTGSVNSSDETNSNPFDELAADEELERLVVLQMAMQRHQIGGGPGQGEEVQYGRDNAKDVFPKRPVSKVITEGFFWREYPSCEQVLYKHMERYYEVSAIQRNYKVQQSFNNVLVKEVRSAAESDGFTFEKNFDDKKLRDRIRCFYKTHLQNAKKRLATLQKHPESIENRCLVAVYIRCVRDRNLSFQESLAMAPNFPKKRRRLDKVEKLKMDVAATNATFAAKIKGQTDQVAGFSSTLPQDRLHKAAATDTEERVKVAPIRSSSYNLDDVKERKLYKHNKHGSLGSLPSISSYDC